MSIEIHVNSEKRSVSAEPDTPLVWVLRDDLELTGTKFGCGVAQCGACTVQIDGVAVRSCQVAVGSVGDAEITTIEAVSGQEAEAVKAAWNELDVVQCGFCQSGQIVQAIDLLNLDPKPSDELIDSVMAGNVCPCATYPRIRAAIHRASEILAGVDQ